MAFDENRIHELVHEIVNSTMTFDDGNRMHELVRENAPDKLRIALAGMPNNCNCQLICACDHWKFCKYINFAGGLAGRTALHVACELGYHECVRVLVDDERIDLNIRDATGEKETPFECARSWYYVHKMRSREEYHEFEKCLEVFYNSKRFNSTYSWALWGMRIVLSPLI